MIHFNLQLDTRPVMLLTIAKHVPTLRQAIEVLDAIDNHHGFDVGRTIDAQPQTQILISDSTIIVSPLDRELPLVESIWIGDVLMDRSYFGY